MPESRRSDIQRMSPEANAVLDRLLAIYEAKGRHVSKRTILSNIVLLFGHADGLLLDMIQNPEMLVNLPENIRNGLATTLGQELIASSLETARLNKHKNKG
jgi:hypothetical protein